MESGGWHAAGPLEPLAPPTPRAPLGPGAPVSAVAPAPVSAWREPTRPRPLRWGHYADRYLWAIVLLVGSAVALPSGNTFALFQIVLGVGGAVAGWIVLPGRRRRRAAAVVPGVLGVAALLIGPPGLPLLVLPFLSWLWVRERPAASYLAAIPLLVVSATVASGFDGWAAMPVAYAVTALVFVGCAWLARGIARLPGGRTVGRAGVTAGGSHGPAR